MEIEGASNSRMTYRGNVSMTETAPANDSVKSVESDAVDTVVRKNIGEDSLTQQPGNVNREEQTEFKTGTEALKKAVEEINRNAKNSEAIFGVHEATNRITIKIVDKESKKVIKEFPPEKTLDMIAKVWEMAGLMVDEKR